MDKRIARLQDLQKQEKAMAAKYGKGNVSPFNDPKTTGYVIKYNKIKRESIKNGDSGRVTRLKAKRAVKVGKAIKPNKAVNAYGGEYWTGSPRDLFAASVADQRLKRAQKKQEKKNRRRKR